MVDYQVAIPSYKRALVCRNKSYKTLIDGGVPSDRITVFVADEAEEAEYRAAMPDAQIVRGRLGLVKQREFISSKYPRHCNLLFVDDDITQIKRLDGDKLARVEDVDAFIQDGFQRMHEVGSHIWGIYPAASAMYMKRQPEVTTGLAYIIGAFYGILNDYPPILMLGDNQEDKERTLLYWRRYKKLLRLNHATILTRYYAPGGMDSPTRKAETDAGTTALVTEFPYWVKRVFKPKQGIWDVRFIPQPAEGDYEDTTLSVLPRRAGYEAARDALLVELGKVTVPTLGKPSTPERRKRHGVRADNIGSIGRSATLGFGRTRMHGIAEFRFNKKWPELLRALIEFGNTIAPPGWTYTAITLNHNVLARKHRDTSNVGRSIIVGIGDYKGGALRVWDPTDIHYDDINLKDQPTMFNGALRTHETQPFEGSRYTIIYYRQKWEGGCAGMPPMIGKPDELTPAGGAGDVLEL